MNSIPPVQLQYPNQPPNSLISLNSIFADHPKYQTTATAHSEGTVHEQPEQALQVALDYYRPMCKECDLAMRRHHTYSEMA